MTSLKLVKIKFFFPRVIRGKNKRELVRLLMKAMRKDGSIEYAGYLKDEVLKKALLLKIGDANIEKYRPLTAVQRQRVVGTIQAAVRKCYRTLPYPQTPIFVFVFPWLPTRGESISFEGVNAMAAYVTIHIFLDVNAYTDSSLERTIAHEWSHLVFYRYHDEKKYTLLDHMVMEGLAECFREEIFGGEPASWSTALTKEEAKLKYKSLKQFLYSKSTRLQHAVLFGSKKFKKWIGYSIGYWMVRSFRKKNRRISWNEIMVMGSEEIFKGSVFLKK